MSLRLVNGAHSFECGQYYGDQPPTIHSFLYARTVSTFCWPRPGGAGMLDRAARFEAIRAVLLEAASYYDGRPHYYSFCREQPHNAYSVLSEHEVSSACGRLQNSGIICSMRFSCESTSRHRFVRSSCFSRHFSRRHSRCPNDGCRVWRSR